MANDYTQFLSYTLTRVICVNCGTFEHGTQGKVIATCPKCKAILYVEAQCTGKTFRPLPFTTLPRIAMAGGTNQVKRTPGKMTGGDGVGVGEWKSGGKQANGKSTGRPRGGNGRGATNYRGESHSKYRYEGKFRGSKANGTGDDQD